MKTGKFGRVVGLLAGAVLVQVAVTACGGATGRALAAGDGGAGGGADEGHEPEVHVVACAPFNGGSTTVAIVELPGHDVASLAERLTASATLAPGYMLFGDPSWSTVQVREIALKEGKAAVVCNGSGGPKYASVTFVLR